MKTPLFNWSMRLRLAALFAIIGMAAAVLPFPRFNYDLQTAALPTPLQQNFAIKFLAVQAIWHFNQ